MTNGAATFIAVCMGILTVEMTAVLVAVIILSLRVSRAVQSVEVLVYRLEDKVAAFKTGWMRVFQGAAGLFTGFLGARKQTRQAEAADGAPAGRY